MFVLVWLWRLIRALALRAQSAAFAIWNLITWVFTRIARVIIAVANVTMFPQSKTGRPRGKAVIVWLGLNSALYGLMSVAAGPDVQAWAGLTLASFHFMIIVSALLVIAEENDVWAGYIRFDRPGSLVAPGNRKDYRSLKRGKVLKSLPLIVISALAYLVFLAVGVKGLHAESSILSLAYRREIAMESYILTVAAQVPVFDAIIKWTGVKIVMEFQGMTGIAIKQLIYVTNGIIIIGTFNSYFRQKSQIRRLIQGLASKKGDIPVLQAFASRAPEEIKSAILRMAIEHPEAHTRRRAMAVAMYANILTFPQTTIHHLHLETVEQNKRRAIAVSIDIIRNNLPMLEAPFTHLLRRKIHIQLHDNRQHHSDHVLSMLMELRAILPPIERFNLAAE
jgi:hypothetical protein